ncbi:hypothetical protein [uncultured Anaerococcus sp.]|uniref:hypothetical protein n=1 Tax=uncultured Anaerococcus sp. TaxID=293428 RepID=UPI0025CF790D|nr:hypothetical protein [uncultured Anaerococcus sp.]
MRYNGFEYIDISDKQHYRYKDIIRLASKLSSEFKIVDEYESFVLSDTIFKRNFIKQKRSNKWEGSINKGKKAYIYYFKINEELINYFLRYDSFLVLESDQTYLNTFFHTQYDYSFLEKDTGNAILFLITHEGLLLIRKDIYEKYIK